MTPVVQLEQMLQLAFCSPEGGADIPSRIFRCTCDELDASAELVGLVDEMDGD